MLATMIQKELKAILMSPKFTATFLVCTVLMLLSVFTGLREYQASVDSYEIATGLVDQELKQITSWGDLETRVYRQPDPMQILVAGLNNDIGRWSDISPESSVKLKHSSYSDDPIFAMFRFIDFAFIVQFVLTLLAILFTYDAISGEREQGTLKLVFANSVPRTQYIIGKCIGSWLGLIVPISIPILLSLGLILAFGVQFTAAHWLSIFLLIGISLLLFTFFIVLGVLVSTMTRHSNSSFLLSLVVWVMLVLIIPRSAIMVAGQVVPVPRVAEIEGQRDAYAANQWDEFYSNMEGNWGHFSTESGEDDEVDEAALEEAMWAAMMRQDSARKLVERDIEAFEIRLLDDLRQRKIDQQRLAYTLSRFSPVSAYQLAAMNLAQTDAANKRRWETSMSHYRTLFNEYAETNQKESGDIGGVMIAVTFEDNGDGEGESNLSIGGNRNKDVLDLSDMPQFQPPDREAVQTAGALSIDFGILILSIMITFAGAFVRFIRYDLR